MILLEITTDLFCILTDVQNDNEVTNLGSFFLYNVFNRVLKVNKIVISVVDTTIIYVTKLRQRGPFSKCRALSASRQETDIMTGNSSWVRG